MLYLQAASRKTVLVECGLKLTSGKRCQETEATLPPRFQLLHGPLRSLLQQRRSVTQ